MPPNEERLTLAIAALVAPWLLFGINRALAPGSATVGLILLLVIPLLTWSGLVLLFDAFLHSLHRSITTGTVVYGLLGVALTLTGIANYIDSGYPPMLLLWPLYTVWLHACPFGVGFWPCPGG